jgi:hypothetical protein
MADISYLLNDPTTPNLIIPVDLPPVPGILEFKIDGFCGPTDTMYTLEHQAAMCYYSIVQAINLMNKILGKPNAWSSTNVLYVQPRAGKQFNAFYDRTGLRFFYAMDPVTKKLVYASNSSDVVLHEAGHALLDALRPDLYNVQAMEIWAFHEAFGDIHTIINMLQHDEVLDFALSQTGGNLAQSNIITRIAEEMGQAIYDVTGGKGGYSAAALRDAFNSYTYVEPEKLPTNGMDNQLTSEPHNFSRVLTGAWYDLLVAVYSANKDAGMSAKDALIQARDILTSYTYNAIPNVPATIRFFDGFAKSLLVQDKINNYKYNSVMNAVFIKRNILRQAVRPMSAVNWSLFKNMIEPNNQVLESPQVTTVRNKEIYQLTLPDHMVNVESPNDSYYEFDANGNCVETIVTSASELIEHARICVNFLKEKGLIRPDRSTPFEIDNEGNLVRSHFACICNGTNPTAPEYLKAYKIANNAGCHCHGLRKPTCCVPAPPKIVVGTNRRYNYNGCGFATTTGGSGTSLAVVGSSTATPVC